MFLYGKQACGDLGTRIFEIRSLRIFIPGFIRCKYKPNAVNLLKMKGKVVPLHAMEAHWVTGGTAPTIS
jgi:hypothetical protein